MATRNLTKKYVELRSGSKVNKQFKTSDDSSDERVDKGLLHRNSGDSSSWKLKGKALPPRWVEVIENIEEDIKQIESKSKDLSQMHTRRLMVNFESDEAAQEREIDYKTQEITELFRHAELLLKKFSRNDSAETIPAAELTVRTNIQRSIAKRLQGLSTSFRGTQKEYLNRLKTQKAGDGAFDIPSSSKKGAYEAETDTGFSGRQLELVDDMEDLVNQRDQEITHIAKSIEELAQIFKELAVLVIDQGTILDRIDYNMETAVEHAKEGVKQLEKAEEHQKNSVAMKCIFVLILLIIIMVIVLIVKHTNFKKK